MNANYSNFINPLQDHLDQQAKQVRSRNRFSTGLAFVIGLLLAGVTVYYFVKVSGPITVEKVV